MEPEIRILAVCGSLGAKSGNLDLLRRACQLAPAGVHITLLPPVDGLPHFNPDLEKDGSRVPEVQDLRRQVSEASALLIATPEYGFSLPGSLKNAIDWLIGSGELEQKLVGVTASVTHPTRGRSGIEALLVPLRAVSARVVGAVPLVRNEDFDAHLGALIAALCDAVREAAQAKLDRA